jgi:hypothetical protein
MGAKGSTSKKSKLLKGLGSENDFDMTEVELVDFKIILVCIYRSPHSDCYTFLNKLETVICKVQMKGVKLILCGDWNINFLQDSAQLCALQNLLNTYCDLLDVHATNKKSSCSDDWIY